MSMRIWNPLANHTFATVQSGTPPLDHEQTNSANTRTQRTLDGATFSEIWHDALLPYLGTRLVLVIVGLLANFYLMPLTINKSTLYAPFPQALWLMWKRFDSGFYLSIARGGYGPAGAADWVFYPLYPLLTSGVGRLLGGGYTSLVLAGLLISNLASIAAIIYLYLLVRKEWNRSVAGRAVLYLAIFPMSFYLSAVYTEGLFLALAIACIYYARKQSWWIAGFCGCLAASCRSQGIMLVIPLAWEYSRVLSQRYVPHPTQLPQKRIAQIQIQLRCYFQGLRLAAREFKNWFTCLSLALVPGGLLAFMLYARSQTGNLMTTFHVDQTLWGRQLSYPWRLLIFSLRHPTLGDPMNWNFWLLNIIMAFAFLGFTIWAFRRLPMIYALYTATMVLLPLSANLLNSIARLYLVVFPAFILLALFSREDKPNRHTLIFASFIALQVLFMVFFVVGMHTIA
jgi:hypothetical protein